MVLASLNVQLFDIPGMVQKGPADTDAVLVKQAAAGDGVAFRQIFDRHAPGIRRYLLDLLRDSPAADEATQETFVRAHARLAALREPERLGSWLFGIARLVHLEQRRAGVRLRPSEDVEAESSAAAPRAAPSPEQLALGREADALLADALGKLTEDRRAALVLRIDHGLGYPEIAAQLGWSLAKVKNEIHRARLQLRSSLAAYVGGEA
jgi:RNA polymerase sigma-70 factor (ECF subfamily)